MLIRTTPMQTMTDCMPVLEASANCSSSLQFSSFWNRDGLPPPSAFTDELVEGSGSVEEAPSFSFPPPPPVPALESSSSCPGDFYTPRKKARRVIATLTPGDRQCTGCQICWDSVTAFTNSDFKHQDCGSLCQDMCNGCRARMCDCCHRSLIRWSGCKELSGPSCLISCSKKEKRSKKRKKRSSASAGESGSTLLTHHMSLCENLLQQGQIGEAEQASEAPESASRASAPMRPKALFEDEHQQGVSVWSGSIDSLAPYKRQEQIEIWDMTPVEKQAMNAVFGAGWGLEECNVAKLWYLRSEGLRSCHAAAHCAHGDEEEGFCKV